MKAKKIPEKKRAKKTTAATKGARKKGTRKKKKAATTPVGDIMRNAAEVIQLVAKNIRP